MPIDLHRNSLSEKLCYVCSFSESLHLCDMLYFPNQAPRALIISDAKNGSALILGYPDFHALPPPLKFGVLGVRLIREIRYVWSILTGL